MITWILLLALVATCIVAFSNADPGSRHLPVAPLLVGGLAIALGPLAHAAPGMFGRDPWAVLTIVQVVILAAALGLALHVLNKVRTARLDRIANEDSPDLAA